MAGANTPTYWASSDFPREM